MIESNIREIILSHVHQGGNLILLLDYDGTIQPIADTPEQAIPDEALLELLAKLSQNRHFRVGIISGRPLRVLKNWLPFPNFILAGIYGAEIMIEGKVILRGFSEDRCRLIINEIKEKWGNLFFKRRGFLLEDKGFAIALHARWADNEEASLVLDAARNMVMDLINPDQFKLIDGNKFLEVAPSSANKGLTVDWLLTQLSLKDELPIYFGDDNKDEEAFLVIRRWGGFSIAVGNNYPLLQADEHLASPDNVRAWLAAISSQE